MTNSSNPAAPDPASTLLSDFQRRIAITIAALVLYRFEVWVPAPGVDVAALSRYAEQSQSALWNNTAQYGSIVAIGLTAAFSIYVVFEFAKLIFSDVRDWGTETAAGATRRERGLAIVILALTAFQAYGVSVGLSHLAGPDTADHLQIVREPGAAFTFGFIASNIAGTALLLWLASIITRYGIGSGFWVLYLFPAMAEASSLPFTLAARTGAGDIAASLSLILLVVMIVMSAIAITLARRWLTLADQTAPARPSSTGLRARAIGVLVWPGFIALAISGYIIWAVTALINPNGDSTGLSFTSPQMLAIPPLLIIATTYLYVRAYFATSQQARQNLSRLTLATAVFIAVSHVVIETLVLQLGVAVSLSALAWIAMLAILTVLLPRDVSPYLPSSAADPPITDADFDTH
jgi:preprotein translocase subunit SecY